MLAKVVILIEMLDSRERSGARERGVGLEREGWGRGIENGEEGKIREGRKKTA